MQNLWPQTAQYQRINPSIYHSLQHWLVEKNHIGKANFVQRQQAGRNSHLPRKRSILTRAVMVLCQNWDFDILSFCPSMFTRKDRQNMAALLAGKDRKERVALFSSSSWQHSDRAEEGGQRKGFSQISLWHPKALHSPSACQKASRKKKISKGPPASSGCTNVNVY